MGLHSPKYNPQLFGYIFHVFLAVIHGHRFQLFVFMQ
jgi:hypothetical protein